MNILVVFSKICKIEMFDITNKFPQSLSTFLIEVPLDLKIKVLVKGKKKCSFFVVKIMFFAPVPKIPLLPQNVSFYVLHKLKAKATHCM